MEETPKNDIVEVSDEETAWPGEAARWLRLTPAKLGGDGERHLEGIRHGSISTEEVKRPGRMELSSGEQCWQPVDAGPAMNAVD